MGDDGDARLGAAVDEASTEGAIVEGAERNLDCRDRCELERLVQLAAVDVGDPHALHEALIDESDRRAHRGLPRRPRIGCMDEVEVDRQAVQSRKARFAVRANRLRATVRNPAAAGPSHAAFRHDARARLSAPATKSAGEQRLVVP